MVYRISLERTQAVAIEGLKTRKKKFERNQMQLIKSLYDIFRHGILDRINGFE